jgi:hypothetical protein
MQYLTVLESFPQQFLDTLLQISSTDVGVTSVSTARTFLVGADFQEREFFEAYVLVVVLHFLGRSMSWTRMLWNDRCYSLSRLSEKFGVAQNS